MSTTIYLIRHGESEANQRDVFLGHYNLPLTQMGRTQAGMTANYLKNQAKRPDAIYSSDLIRAYETAQCTAKCFDMSVIKDKNLREIDAGLWDNMTFDDLMKKYKETYDVWMNNIGYARCDGGESVEELQKRVVSAVTHIAKKHTDGTVYIFTHATPIRALAAHCLGKSLSELKSVCWASNASVTRVVYDGGLLNLDEYSRDEFMGECVTKLSSNT